MATKTEWRIIIDFPNYKISNHGSVWDNVKHRAIKSHNRVGNRNVNLKTVGIKTTRDVHVLLARAFIPNPYDLPEVDHINRIRNDNRLENLRWVTDQENQYNRSNTKGYYFNKVAQKFQATISHNGKIKYLGLYDTEARASSVYLAAKAIYHIIGKPPKIVVNITLKQIT
jgi:hypothetical protein